jgi:hypothetical protein
MNYLANIFKRSVTSQKFTEAFSETNYLLINSQQTYQYEKRFNKWICKQVQMVHRPV